MSARTPIRIGLLAGAVSASLIAAPGCNTRNSSGSVAAQQSQADQIPVFEYDPSWPKQLPNGWITGPIGAMTTDVNNHIWLIHRPGATTGLSERFGLRGFSECCWPAPPVMEFDTEGNLLQAWGAIEDGRGQLLGKQVSGPYPAGAWPTSEHGLWIDHKNNVWVDSQSRPSSLIKLTRDGKFLMRIGKEDGKSSNDTANLAGPTGILVDPKTNEVYVADGYRNRRVIVFDADTGAYKRHWGAYGKPPLDPQAPATENDIPDAAAYDAKYDRKARAQQFDHVHCLVQDKDGLLYVCDRANNRIQVFKTDGTFVKEAFVAPETRGFGAAMVIAFSPDQRLLYLADGANHKVWFLRREDLKILGSFGRSGRGGGQFLVIHALAVDAQGNLYVGETIPSYKVQKFRFTGMRPAGS